MSHPAVLLARRRPAQRRLGAIDPPDNVPAVPTEAWTAGYEEGVSKGRKLGIGLGMSLVGIPLILLLAWLDSKKR